MKKLGLYVHIPFCKSKCAYCDFLSFCNLDNEDAYIDKLLQEVSFYGERLKGCFAVDTVFIGGGTPSILKSGTIKKIVNKIYQTFAVDENVEISVESNPESLTLAKIDEYKDCCTRVSLGVQSLSDSTLSLIGRAHDSRQARLALDRLSKTNLNVNADIILGLPNETIDTTLNTVREILDYGITHLSAYGLSIEKGTKLCQMIESRACSVPDGDQVADVYDKVLNDAKRFGLYRYEVSNFAKLGFECKHNLGYWTRKNYLGVGLGAHSLLENARFYNTQSMSEYLDADDFEKIKVQESLLDKNDELEETIMLGLRLRDGINAQEILREYGVDVFERFKKGIKKLERVLDITKTNIKVKEEYFYSLNAIIVEFLE